MKQAVIDIGSNSIHFIIYHDQNDKYEPLMEQRQLVGLINYIDNDSLQPEGIDALTQTLRQFQKTFQQLEVEKTYYFATAVFRYISNCQDILKYIHAYLNIDIEVLSHMEEGVLDFYGMQKSMNTNAGVLIDIGGGSSEIIHFENYQIIQNQSYPIGSLNLYNNFVKGITPTTKELNLMNQYIKKQLQSLDKQYPFPHGIGIGGTMRAIIFVARHLLKKNHIENMITKEEIDYLIRQLTQKSKKSAHTILKVKPDRIHTIIPGLVLLKEMMSILKIKDITICYTGLREGYFYHKVLKEKEY